MKREPKTYKNFRYLNLAPSGFNSTFDCSIRAVALALGWSWRKARRKIWRFAYRYGADASDDSLMIFSFLQMHSKVPCTYVQNERKYTASQFAHHFNKGTWVLLGDGHVTCAVDGYVYDNNLGYMSYIPIYAWRVK